MSSPLFQSMTLTLASDGNMANIVELTNSQGSSIVVMDIGATWLSCSLALKSGERREVLLGIATMEQFLSQGAYLGASVGRYANRIKQGRFSIAEQAYQLSVNLGGNTLHGGEVGFDKQRWDIIEQADNTVTMTFTSPDGDQGFPGNLEAKVSYTLTEENRVEIEYSAQCDKACPVNLTNHAYFNLLGTDSDQLCLEHTLKLESKSFLPINDVGIPLGINESVEGNGFDFRQPKQIAKEFLLDEQQKSVNGYDHSFILPQTNSLYSPAATLTSPDNEVTMTVFTDKPAIQLYTGNFLGGTPRREGGVYADHAGVALETQYLPDSPNHPEWPHSNSILEPGDEYCFTTVYQFDVS
ncbi:galactose-1-epimerase [Vibrio sp. WJH972]